MAGSAGAHGEDVRRAAAPNGRTPARRRGGHWRPTRAIVVHDRIVFPDRVDVAGAAPPYAAQIPASAGDRGHVTPTDPVAVNDGPLDPDRVDVIVSALPDPQQLRRRRRRRGCPFGPFEPENGTEPPDGQDVRRTASP